MGGPFVGSEARAAGMSWGELQRGHIRVFRDVYVDVDIDIDASLRAKAAWLWSRRQGVVAGLGAAALHGSLWVDKTVNVDVYHGNRHRMPGLTSRAERVSEDEICVVQGVPVTTPVRTALDLACWNSLIPAVAAIDALAKATGLMIPEVQKLADDQAGRRGIVQARRAIALADAGAQSPKESWLRTVIICAGLPRPRTQIPVFDEFGRPWAYLDMGWENLMVAVEYDGDHHRTRRSQYSYDIRRIESLQRRGWIVVRVTAEDSVENVLRRVRDALARRRDSYLHARRPA